MPADSTSINFYFTLIHADDFKVSLVSFFYINIIYAWQQHELLFTCVMRMRGVCVCKSVSQVHTFLSYVNLNNITLSLDCFYSIVFCDDDDDDDYLDVLSFIIIIITTSYWFIFCFTVVNCDLDNRFPFMFNDMVLQ